MANTRIGVVGSGPGGLHLGLFLQKHGVTTTLYSERTADQIRASKLPNTAIHWWNVRKREAYLGVDHWDGGQVGNHFWVGLPEPLVFKGHFSAKSNIVDNRLYCATLLEDYVKRGGEVVYGAIQAEALVGLSEKHELVVISTGKGTLPELFPRVPEYSLTEPKRRVCTGIYKGITNPQPEYLGVNLVPGTGELYEMPFLTFDGKHTGLLIFVVPGGPWEAVMGVRYEDNPKKFNETVLGIASQFPHIRARIREKEFGLRSALDYLQGAITPTVRRAYAKLANGKYVVAIGDLHVVNDPLMGQGVGCTTNGAFVVGQAILDDGLAFDEMFCKRVEEQMWNNWSRDATAWNNYMLQVPPAANTVDLIIAASKNQVLADAFADNFAAPSKNWNALASFERSRNLLRVLGMDSPFIDAALASTAGAVDSKR